MCARVTRGGRERKWVDVRATWEGTPKAGAGFVTGAGEVGRVAGVPSGAEVSTVCASSAEEAMVMVCRWDGIGKSRLPMRVWCR